MSLILADEGAEFILDDFWNDTAKTFKVKLYTNNVTPADGDTVASYTIATGGGYTDSTLDDATATATGSLAIPTISSVSGIAQVAWTPLIWTFTGALTTNPTIYGYIVTDSSSTFLLFAERLSSSYTPSVAGDTLSLTLRFKMGNVADAGSI